MAVRTRSRLLVVDLVLLADPVPRGDRHLPKICPQRSLGVPQMPPCAARQCRSIQNEPGLPFETRGRSSIRSAPLQYLALRTWEHCKMSAVKSERYEVEDAPPAGGDVYGSDRPDDGQVREPLDVDPVYSYKEQRKIIHRLDRRLITVAGIIYMNSLMDRSNLPNANIAGMDVDLGMDTGFRYVCPRGAVFLGAETDIPPSPPSPWSSSSRTLSSSRPRPS